MKCIYRHLLSGLLLILFSTQAFALSNQADPELRSRLKLAIEQSDSFKDRFDAEVWLLDMSTRLKKRVPDSNERLHLLKNIHREATRVKLAPELVLAVIDIESRFDPYAISRSGAQGLMQVMPFWLNEIGHPDDNLIHIKTNLRMGCTILKYYIDKEKGNLRRALARYNGSLGKHWKYPDKVFTTLHENWFRN
ncbi:MAG: transglycosylase SLT domain-containing protein [Gammaproteobacteria bacterium]|nr:transglycosylase SLT domain-containing protein [Gammaproteobacteria bacterium]MCW8910724.1 transglycosylase SLT domain-containing protein [Gammaproteobacteria bacterium]MCW9005422.1 transglycosylase SLT domain-containing protein [Gammaproteobacteria bacterium]